MDRMSTFIANVYVALIEAKMGSTVGYAAMVYSLLATCKLHGINPYHWLRDVLENMHRFTTNNIEQLLPQNWKKLPEV